MSPPFNRRNARPRRLDPSAVAALLPFIRDEVPGFAAIEEYLVRWLHEQYGTVVELYFAHGLRQSPETLKSTGFDVHQVRYVNRYVNRYVTVTTSLRSPLQDVEDFPFIEYTVVVKLTPDGPGEPASKMRVVGAPRHFEVSSSHAFLSCLQFTPFYPAAAHKPQLPSYCPRDGVIPSALLRGRASRALTHVSP